jgi:hypothetical protein
MDKRLSLSHTSGLEIRCVGASHYGILRYIRYSTVIDWQVQTIGVGRTRGYSHTVALAIIHVVLYYLQSASTK